MGLLSYRYEIGRTGFLPAYVGTIVEYENVANFRNQLFDDALFNGSVYFGYRSPIGPLYVGYGFAEGDASDFSCVSATSSAAVISPVSLPPTPTAPAATVEVPRSVHPSLPGAEVPI